MTTFKSAAMYQVIDGVPSPMNYQIEFPDGFDPTVASQGRINARPNKSVVTGVYDYTPATSKAASTLSMSLTCTEAGNPGPQANTCTIFSGTLCDSGPVLFVGTLYGVPPLPGPSSFAQGLFVLRFLP